MLVLNGSFGEGGGALLRTALALSALTQQPVRVHTIRGAMRTKGITSEDLCFVRALAVASAARLTGDELLSEDLTFSPTRPPRGLNHRLDVGEFEKGTIPGNALIVAESLLPVLARSGVYSRLVVHGETHNNNTLSYDAFERVTLAVHRRQGLYAFPTLNMAGFGYGARGEVELEVEPSVLQGLDWSKRGKLRGLSAVISLAELPEDVGERGETHLKKLAGGQPIVTKTSRRVATSAIDVEPDVEVLTVRSRGPGVFVTVWAEFENAIGCGTALGARGVRMETVVENAFDAFFAWYRTDATVDPFLADQILLPAAFAEAPTVFTTSRVTQRLITMSWVIKQFLPIHITIHGREGEPGSVTVNR